MAARGLLGRDPGEVPVGEWSSAFHCLLPDMVTRYPPELLPLTRTLRGEVFPNLELFMLGHEAREGVWRGVSGPPIRDARGAIEGGAVVLRNITPVKRKLQQVELLSNIVEATADVVVVTDHMGRIEYVNPAFEAATGYTMGKPSAATRASSNPARIPGRSTPTSDRPWSMGGCSAGHS